MRIKIPVFLILGLLVATTAQATMIDLNDFYFYPGDPVTISPDGSQATIGEDPVFTSIPLFNDPFLGHPEVILAGDGVPNILTFSYTFTEDASMNHDEFVAFIFDADTGAPVGADFIFTTGSSSSGSVSFDLSPLVGKTLGMEFQLNIGGV
jgi:hypothetical protein